jgi:hypothetical protein
MRRSIFLKALEKSPDERYQRAGALAVAFRDEQETAEGWTTCAQGSQVGLGIGRADRAAPGCFPDNRNAASYASNYVNLDAGVNGCPVAYTFDYTTAADNRSAYEHTL